MPKKLLCLLGILLAGALGLACSTLGLSGLGGDMTLFQDRGRIHPGPLRQYHVGRYTFNLPQDYAPAAYRFSLTPVQTRSKGRSITSKIEINELPWKTRDHAAEFEEQWRPLQEKVTAKDEELHARIFGPGNKPYAENLDAAACFGHKSVSICNTRGGYPHPINSFLALPQGIVHFVERRGGGRPLTPTCSNLEGPAAELFKHYTWGKRPAERNDTFYTAMGMVTGYSAEKEEALLRLHDQQTDIGVTVELEYDSRWTYHPELDRIPSKAEVLAQARALGADFQIVSDSMRRVAGRDLLEFIFTGKEAPEEPDYLEFQAKTVTDANFTVTADAPMISIRLACLWDQREQAMIVWNTVLNSLQHVRAAQR